MNTLMRKTWRDLRRSWTLALALVVIIALGIATYVASLGAYRDLGTSYEETYARLHFADIFVRFGVAPASIVDDVAAIPGVRAVEGRLIVDTGYRLANGELIRSRLIGLPTERHPRVNDILLLDGRYFRPGERGVTIVESHFAEFYDIHPGDEVTPLMNGHVLHLKVVGIAVSPEYLIVTPGRQELLPSARTFAVLFLPRDDVQRLVRATDAINDLSLLLEPEADREAIIKRVRALLAPYGIVDLYTREHQPSNEGLHLDLEGFREIAFFIPLLMLFVAAISVYIVLGREVRTQQPHIGVMKAIGYSDRAILAHYLVFALIIGIVGALLGALMGVPLERMMTRAYARELGIPIVKTRFYADVILVGLVVSLITLVMGSLGPARSAAHLPPAQAMRMDPAVALVQGRRLFFERWFPMRTWLRLSFRNVFRIRRRSLGTVLGVVFAFILILASWDIIYSMNFLLYRMFHDIERWDLEALYNVPLTETVLSRVAHWDGVEEVAPMSQVPAQLSADGRSETLLLMALDPERTLHMPVLPKGTRLAQVLGPGRLVITRGIADKLGVDVGDVVTLKTAFGSVRLTISAISKDPMASVAYVSLQETQTWAHAPAPFFNALALRVDKDHIQAVKKRLYALPGAYSVQYKEEVERDWRKLMGLFYLIMGILLAFAVILAGAVVFNTMTVSVLEREREFATMRALGTPVGLLARMMVVESVMMWAIALLPGMVLGTWVSHALARTFTSELFYFDLHIGWVSYLLTAVSILTVMILSAWPGIRRMKRINLAQATKTVT